MAQQRDLVAELERRLAPPSPGQDLVSELEKRLAPAPRVTPANTPVMQKPAPIIQKPAPAMPEVTLTMPPSLRPISSHASTAPRVQRPLAPAPTPIQPVASHAPPQTGLDRFRESTTGMVARGAARGVAGLAEGVTGLARWAGVVGDETLRNVQTRNADDPMLNPEVATRRIMDDPGGTIGNPQWWAFQGGQAASSMASLVGVGAGTAAMTAVRYAPAAMAALTEALTEGGSAYSEAIAAGATPDQAGAAAAKVVAVNLPLLGVSNIPVLEGVGKGAIRQALTAAASEGTQEVGQQVTSNVAARGYDPTRGAFEGALEAGVVGGMAGAGARTALSRGRLPVQPPAMAAPALAPAAAKPSAQIYGPSAGRGIEAAHQRAQAVIAGLESRIAQTPQAAPSAVDGVTTPSPAAVEAAVAPTSASPTGAAPMGTVRMYHGGADDSPTGGRWFSSDRRYAEEYARKSGGSVSYVDLPEGHPLIASEYPEQSIAKGFHQNVELPEDIARGRRQVDDWPPVASIETELEKRIGQSPETPPSAAPADPREARERGIDEHIGRAMPKAFPELPAVERREMRRILEELTEFTYDKGGMQRAKWWETGTLDENQYTPRQANASVYAGAKNDVKSRTGKQIRQSIEKWIAGTGRLTTVGQDAVRVARERAYRNPMAYTGKGTSLPAGDVEGEIYATPRRFGKPDFARELDTIARVEREHPQILEAYRGKHGRVYNADNMSELVDVHGETRWQHHDAVRSPAGALVQKGFDEDLSAEPTDTDVVVQFSAGGTGSGKSTVFADIPEGAIGLDSTLANYEQSKKNLRAVLNSGRGAAITFVYRDPVDAYVNGVATRRADPANGRDVPIGAHASTHVNAPATFLRLAEEYAAEKRPDHEAPVLFFVVENTSAGRVERDVEWLREQAGRYTDANAVAAAIREATGQEAAGGHHGPREEGRQRDRATGHQEPRRSGPQEPAQVAATEIHAAVNEAREAEQAKQHFDDVKTKVDRAQRLFSAVTAAYRRGELTDQQYLSARKANDDVLAVFDRAHARADKAARARKPSTHGDLFDPDEDRLSTGERQPRLPGDVRKVRDKEVAQPKLELPEKPFELTGQVEKRKAKQTTLFEPFSDASDHADVTVGSPTRSLYAAGSLPVTPYRGGRPISEQETVTRVREIFGVDRVTPSVLGRLLGEAKTVYPIRVKKLPRAFGDYNPQTGLIRLRRAFDLTTTSHELGHMISDRMFGTRGPVGLFRQELADLGRATTPASKITEKGSPYQIEEGVAEYFRTWFADPKQAERRAPEFTRAVREWLNAHPAAELQFMAVQAVVQRYLSQPTVVRGRARVSVRPATLRERGRDVVASLKATPGGGFLRRFAAALKETGNVPALWKDPHAWFDNLSRHWFDRHTAIARAVVDMQARGGNGLATDENAYVLTRLADGASGMAEGFMKVGPRGKDGRFLGASLESALKPIRHRLYPSGDRSTPDFATYLVALRAHELHTDGKGRWPGLTPAEANAIIAEAHADPEADLFKASAEQVYSYLRGLRQYALEYGMLTPELVKHLDKALFYVPMQRVIDAAADRLSGKAALANRGNTLKKLVGSGRDIIDPIESIAKNTEALINAVEKNRAAAALVKQARNTKHTADWLIAIPQPRIGQKINLKQLAKPILQQLADAGIDVPTSALLDEKFLDEIVTAFLPVQFGDPKQRQITVVENGERRFYQVQDEALYQNLTTLGVSTSSELIKWAAKPTAILRAGATLRPSFIIRNLLRDTVGAMLQSRHGFIPVYDSLRGLVSQLTHDADYQRFVAFGVQSSALLGQDRDRTRHFIEQLARPSDFKAKVRLAWHPIQALRLFSEQIETATRLGEFKLAIESGGKERRTGVLGIAERLTSTRAKGAASEETLTKAALAARDVTVDFARGGQTAKELSQFKAFFNARLQGYVRIVETIQRDPTGAALTVGALAALGAALWALNSDDDEYAELSAQQKRDYWFIKLPGNDWFLTIPKPFEWALVPNLVESALDEHRDAKEAFGLGDSEDVVMQLVPTGILPFVEAITNWNTYQKRPIVSPWDLQKPPDLQTRDWTSDTARALAYSFGVSPAKLEHVTFGLGGGLARDVTGATDPIARILTRRNRPEQATPPITRRVPGLAAILRPSAPDSSSESLQAFYDTLEDFESQKAAIKAYGAGEGMRDAEDARQEFIRTFPQAVAARLTVGKRELEQLRDDLADVRGSRSLTPAQKAQEERALREAMVDAARRALGRPGLTRKYLSRRETQARAGATR